MGFATKDLASNIDALDAFSAAISSDTTTAGAIIDTKGFNSVTFIVQAVVYTDGSYLPLIEDGDAANLSDAAAVADTYLIGTEAGATVDADAEVKVIGYSGTKRYVRLKLVSSSTSSGATLGAVAVLGHPDAAPIAQ